MDRAPIAAALRLRAEWDDEFDPSMCNLLEDAADTVTDLLEALEAICAEAENMSMTMRRRAIFNAGIAAISRAHGAEQGRGE
jgi:hypothetical protein